MGSFDSAEIAELCGLKLLSEIQDKVPEISFGLYRDDGLAVMSHKKGCFADRIRKKLIKIFKDNGLKITIEMRLHKVDYLDVTLDIANNTYRPYKKPNDKIIYIHKDSNHPLNIKKELPKMIEKRLSSISKNEEIFNDSIAEYQNALKNSGFKSKLQFQKQENNEENDNTKTKNKEKTKKKTRKRKVIYFNPPFNASVTTNVGKRFLDIVDKHFNKKNKRKDNLQKIFNRNSLKVGYSCTTNFGNMIKNHNKKILQEHFENKQTTSNKKVEKTCNCRKNDTCPVNQNCLCETVVYAALIKENNSEDAKYIGSTEGPFKQRLYGHKSDQKLEQYKNRTKLSQHIWYKKEKGEPINIQWKIIKKEKKYKSGQKFCQVCNSEKYFILMGRRNNENLLNHRDEICMGFCRHKKRFLLQYVRTTQQNQKTKHNDARKNDAKTKETKEKY